MSASCRITASGGTPGADSNTYVLFSTVVAFPGANYLPENGMKRLQSDIKNSAAGTLNWYKSSDRGLTWQQIGTAAIADPGATSTNNYDWLVEEYADFKLEWVNGGSAQTTWKVDLALSDERNKST